MRKKINYKEAGITLVALVVTIIVLLILAGITLYLLLGQNGVLNRTQYASNTWANATADEEAMMGQIASEIDNLTSINNSGNNGGNNEGNGEIVYSENSAMTLVQSGSINIWDRINYNPGNATTASIQLPEGASLDGTKLASINLPTGTSLGGTINASSADYWVVLDINTTTGEILIMPRIIDETELTLSGIAGYSNGIRAIDAVASIYKNDAYAKSSRGLRKEEVFKSLNDSYEPDDEMSFPHRYGVNLDSTSEHYLEITDEGAGNAKNQTFKETLKLGCDSIKFGGLQSQCWVASRFVDFWASTYPTLGIDVLVDSTYGGLLEVNGENPQSVEEYTASHPVVPVVTLKPSVELSIKSVYYTEIETGMATTDNEWGWRHTEWDITN